MDVDQLTAKALEWVAANENAMLAGSLPLYHYLTKKNGAPPTWIPSDADVWVFAPRAAQHDELFQVNGPDTDQLKFGGRVLCDGPPVISTVTYPFGSVQVIVIGYGLYWNDAPSTGITPMAVLDSFDHTACMIAMTDPDTFALGRNFNVDKPTMIERVSHGSYVVPAKERARFKARLEKYAQRGLAPVAIKPGRVDQDMWLKCYVNVGNIVVSNILA